MVGQGRAVADGEDVVVPFDLEGRSRAHEAAVVERQIRVAEDGQRGGARDPEREVGVEPATAFELDRVRLDRLDLGAEHRLDAARACRGRDPARQGRVVAGQDAVACLDDRRSGFETLASQPRVDAEGEFDSAGAAADDDDPRLRVRECIQATVYRRSQSVDGPRGDRVLPNSGQVECRHGRAHVERGQVEGQRFATIDQQPPGRCLDPGARRHHDAHSGPSRQRHGVDLQLVACVLAGYQAGRHPGVDSDRRVDHESRIDGGVRPHDPVPQHLDVGVPGADQNDPLGCLGRRT